MADQITSCTLQNDADGNPVSYNFAYLFDNGAGITTPALVAVPAQGLTVEQAQAAANAQAAIQKSQWLALISTPAPIDVPSVVGEVTL